MKLGIINIVRYVNKNLLSSVCEKSLKKFNTYLFLFSPNIVTTQM